MTRPRRARLSAADCIRCMTDPGPGVFRRMSAELPLYVAAPESTPLCGGDSGASEQTRLLAAVRAGQLQLVTQLASCHDTDINHL